ncbi:atrial natriuretic peptide-converting enzyme isoform X2 [Sipha flava]|uniref:Atrial natriuretic peptide-converting enzyme isoform X2 n=1 Tax=Sipha flava TaxID=143950 RepID=A0A8B8FFJ3_9HEMI|nr:atrial natriuretic peptide-converting enzyme isoform X2 [Sipha flava]
MASSSKQPEIPPRRRSSTTSPNKIINQNSAEDSQPNSPLFLSRRHSSCIDDTIENENYTMHPAANNASAAIPSIPARRNPGPPVIGPRPAQYKLPPPPRASSCEPPADRHSIRGHAKDHPRETVAVPATPTRDSATTVQQQQQQQPQPQPQQPQQPQPQQPQPQQPQQQQQQPQLRTRRFKVPPPIKCISEPLDGGSRESYEMMTPAMTMSPNRQDSGHWSDSFSVNSSPGYSTKSMETPLLSHAKMMPSRSNKKRFILDRYVVCDQWNGRARFSPANSGPISSSSTAELTKSHSTPASLQAIVEFNENSPNSLQHRVMGTEAIDVTEVFIRLQRRQVLYNAAILIFITVLLIFVVRVGLPDSSGGQSKTASTVVRNPNAAATANHANGSLFKTSTVAADDFNHSSRHPATTNTNTTDLSAKLSDATTTKKNYVPIIPADEIIYDIPVFNPMYSIIDHPKSNLYILGTCLPSFCQNVTSTLAQYLYTVPYKKEYDHKELIALESVVNVRCYELTALYFCALFASKGCGNRKVKPCQSLCKETIRSCGFFFDIFEAHHEHRECMQFPNDTENPNTFCVGHREVANVKKMKNKGLCHEGFKCDRKRCIPMDWRCDGHFDCEDHSDEMRCSQCPDQLFCGGGRCIAVEHICNGVSDCEWGQDERNCVRLSGEMGQRGEGVLELYSPNTTSWRPACIQSWDSSLSATIICNILGYKRSVISKLGTNNKLLASVKYNQSIEYYDENKMTVYREIRDCPDSNLYPSISLSCSNFECGVRRRPQTMYRQSRIVGGRPSLPGDWPFLAAILGGPDEIFYCAGVLISEQWVLTAAHCTGGKILDDLSEWTIQLGMTRRHSHSFFGRKVKVEKIIRHEMYNNGPVQHDHDIALFKLSEKLTFHEFLLPVCLPTPNMVLKTNISCTVIGWGRRNGLEGADYEPTVNEVQVPVLDRDLCNAWLKQKDVNITKGMICAGYEQGGKDACQGDSGGPLLCPVEGHQDRWFVGGIVSWGVECATPSLPGVYVNVPMYTEWITKSIREDELQSAMDEVDEITVDDY